MRLGSCSRRHFLTSQVSVAETSFFINDKYLKADDDAELSHEFRLDVNDAITSWPFIVKDLGTVDTSVLTHFCANGLTLDLAGLISLTAIPTLTTLMHINPAQRQTYPLTGIAIRDWCRAVAEKNAFPNLKLLYLSAISNYQPTDSSVLGHLSSFPALALVGIERSESQLPINNSDTCGQWQRSTANREHKLNTTMHDAQTTIAQKTKALYRHACRVSTSQKEVADVTSVLEGPIQLTLSCYASQSKRDAGTAMWFVRRHYAPLELLKRDLNVLSHRHDGDRGTKKRKIRQTKQCDVGALLDSFGAPAGSE